MADSVINIVVAGLGGQGVLKASDMLAQAAFEAGHDVKKAEVHGMSQRGGSVTSDVRYGRAVFSPMAPPHGADYLLVLEATQVEPSRHRLKPGGVLLTPDAIDVNALPTPKTLNVAMLGLLSRHLDLPESAWIKAIHSFLPEKLHAANDMAFQVGRSSAKKEDADA